MSTVVAQYISAVYGNGIPTANRIATVEVQLGAVPLVPAAPAAGATYKFPKGTVIGTVDVLVYAMEAYSANQQAISTGGFNVIPAAGVPGLTFTIKDNSQFSRIDNNPYFNWIKSLNLGYPTSLTPFRMVMDKSLVTVTDPTNLLQGQTALVSLYYFTRQDLIKALMPYYMTKEECEQGVAEYYETV